MRAARFMPMDHLATPQDLFNHAVFANHSPTRRFTSRYVSNELLLYICSACLDKNNAFSTASRRAGCAVVHSVGYQDSAAVVTGRYAALRLKNQKPTGNSKRKQATAPSCVPLSPPYSLMSGVGKAGARLSLHRTGPTSSTASQTGLRSGRRMAGAWPMAMAVVMVAGRQSRPVARARRGISRVK